MKRFKTVHYTVHSDKIKDARGVRFAVLADLHGVELVLIIKDLLRRLINTDRMGSLLQGI